jgi:ureidoacrylate peracid hydrolase
MAKAAYDKQATALLVIDPYNDFISEGGKIWNRIRAVAEANDCVPHMVQGPERRAGGEASGLLCNAPSISPRRLRDLEVHRAYSEGGVEKQELRIRHMGRRDPRRARASARRDRRLEHWGSSGFANTDLDLQLKRHGIEQPIVIGLIAHTCVEATVRFAAELGYDVTVVRDATSDYSNEKMHAALEVNIPNYASAIVTAKEAIEAMYRL